MPETEVPNATINYSTDDSELENNADLKRRRELLELEGLETENDRLIEKLTGLRNDNAARRRFAVRIFGVIVGWLVLIALVTVHQILYSWIYREPFSENFSLALIGGTTVTVLGLMVIVLNYLFPKGND